MLINIRNVNVDAGFVSGGLHLRQLSHEIKWYNGNKGRPIKRG